MLGKSGMGNISPETTWRMKVPLLKTLQDKGFLMEKTQAFNGTGKFVKTYETPSEFLEFQIPTTMVDGMEWL